MKLIKKYYNLLLMVMFSINVQETLINQCKLEWMIFQENKYNVYEYTKKSKFLIVFNFLKYWKYGMVPEL